MCAGAIMAVERSAAAAATVNEYQATVEKEENRFYQAGLLEAPDLWLWDVVVSPGSKSYSFTAGPRRRRGPGTCPWSLQGASDVDGVIDHHVRVRVNGTIVGEATWDGKVATTLELDAPAGVLREGLNTLEIQDVGDTGAPYSMVFLNRFPVTYPRRLVATGGTLEGRFASSGQARWRAPSARAWRSWTRPGLRDG